MPVTASSKTMIRGTSIVALLTLVSRVLGFVRDLLVAGLFGAGMYADAFFVAFRIPNLLRSLVAEGAMSAAFVPVFSGELVKGQEQARRAMQITTGFLLIVTCALSIAGIFLARPLVELLAPGFLANPEKLEICVLLTRIMLPYIIFVSLVALIGGALNTIKIFGTAAFSQVAMNIVLIAGALLAAAYQPRPAVILLALSVMAGGVVQVVVQIPALKRAGFLSWPSFAIRSPVIKDLLWLMLPATIGSAIYQISIFMNTLLASLLGEGSVSWLFYADRLAQLPLGIFSVALASVLLPMLAGAAARDEQDNFSEGLINSLRYTSFIIIPMAFLIYQLAVPLIQLLFERGAFSHDSTIKTALAVQALSLGLWGSSCHAMLIRGFIARKDTITPTLIGLFALLVSVPLSMALMGPPLHPDAGFAAGAVASFQALPLISSLGINLRHAGLGVSSSIASTLAFFLVALLFWRRIHLNYSAFVRGSLISLLGSLFMCLVFEITGISSLPMYQSLPLGLILGPLSYLAFCGVAKSREFQETFKLFSRLVRGR